MPSFFNESGLLKKNPLLGTAYSGHVKEIGEKAGLSDLMIGYKPSSNIEADIKKLETKTSSFEKEAGVAREEELKAAQEANKLGALREYASTRAEESNRRIGLLASDDQSKLVAPASSPKKALQKVKGAKGVGGGVTTLGAMTDQEKARFQNWQTQINEYSNLEGERLEQRNIARQRYAEAQAKADEIAEVHNLVNMYQKAVRAGGLGKAEFQALMSGEVQQSVPSDAMESAFKAAQAARSTYLQKQTAHKALTESANVQHKARIAFDRRLMNWAESKGFDVFNQQRKQEQAFQQTKAKRNTARQEKVKAGQEFTQKQASFEDLQRKQARQYLGYNSFFA